VPSAYSGKVQGRRDPVPNTIATATTKKDNISEAAKSQGPERADVISDKTSTTKVEKNPKVSEIKIVHGYTGGESTLYEEVVLSPPPAKKSKTEEVIEIDDSSDNKDDSNVGCKVTMQMISVAIMAGNASTLSGTDCGMFSLNSQNGLHFVEGKDCRSAFSNDHHEIKMEDINRLIYTDTTPYEKRKLDDTLVLFAMNW
jgi:hypothetical protein